ncbi:MAG TPA: zinc-dependent metalloprotease, partial [Acidobacteriaceae bacterium]|nr:zinc-dependent metalloprotease [Acidobacteriaceae bacterium]
YGYRQFAPGVTGEAETSALDRILEASQKRGIPYITDQDARPLGSAHPHAHLWDNGADAADELNRVLAVRAAALGRFGEAAIREHVPMAELEETLVPLYLFHRYQTEAAAKVIGGLQYEYNLRGDGEAPPKIVDGGEQRKALAAVLRTLSPEVLTMPESLLAVLPPQPPGFPRTQESFASHTGLTFDPVAAAESAADLTLGLLFDPERASRLVQYHARDPQMPGLDEVIAAVFRQVGSRPTGMRLDVVVSRAVQMRAVEALLALAANPGASAEARAEARNVAVQIKSAPPAGASLEEGPLNAAIKARVEQFEREPEKFVPGKPVAAPPGMPIGDEEEM